MLKTCYSFLLRLHPAPFRREYEKQMLAIFDEVAAGGNVFELFTDMAASLFRQWVLRPGFRRASYAEPVPPVPADAPLLSTLDSYAPRPAAVLVGCLLTLASFSAVVTVSIRPGKSVAWLIGIRKAASSIFSVSRSSLTGSDVDTVVKVGEEPENPWRPVASAYFKLIPVLGALDTNGDFVISPGEMLAARLSLRRLDVNHDGKLSPEECGFRLGQGPPAQKEFMRAHPVLAALDADHDGEISAEEITDSLRHLLTLDRNRDGFLTPEEVMPERRR
jgi:hypothetical protein